MNKHWLVNPLNIFIIAGITFLVTIAISHDWAQSWMLTYDDLSSAWFPTLIISILYFANRNTTIKSPSFCIIHLFEKAVVKVGPGLYLLFPGVSIDERTGEEFPVPFGDANILTGENNIGVGISGTIWLRANEKLGDIKKLLRLPENVAFEKAKKAANTTLEEEVSKREAIIKLLKEKTDIKNAIERNIVEAMGGTLDRNNEQEGGAYVVTVSIPSSSGHVLHITTDPTTIARILSQSLLHQGMYCT